MVAPIGSVFPGFLKPWRVSGHFVDGLGCFPFLFPLFLGSSLSIEFQADFTLLISFSSAVLKNAT